MLHKKCSIYCHNSLPNLIKSAKVTLEFITIYQMLPNFVNVSQMFCHFLSRYRLVFLKSLSLPLIGSLASRRPDAYVVLSHRRRHGPVFLPKRLPNLSVPAHHRSLLNEAMFSIFRTLVFGCINTDFGDKKLLVRPFLAPDLPISSPEHPKSPLPSVKRTFSSSASTRFL